MLSLIFIVTGKGDLIGPSGHFLFYKFIIDTFVTIWLNYDAQPVLRLNRPIGAFFIFLMMVLIQDCCILLYLSSHKNS